MQVAEEQAGGGAAGSEIDGTIFHIDAEPAGAVVEVNRPEALIAGHDDIEPAVLIQVAQRDAVRNRERLDIELLSPIAKPAGRRPSARPTPNGARPGSVSGGADHVRQPA